jgi:hypothetical protein
VTNQPTELAAPAQERPRLLSDEGTGRRVLVILALVIGTLVLGHIVRYVYAAIYYNVLEIWHPITAGYHHLIPNATWRHEGRYAIEGLYAGASIQIVFYNFARHWPPKKAGFFSRWVCRPLLIPNQRLPKQTLWCLALSWFWMIVFAAPVFLLGIWLLTISHTNSNQIGHVSTLPVWIHADQTLLTTWQQPLLGFACSFIGARMVVKGTAFHFQRLIIKERLEAGRTKPAWWMHIFPFLRWRFDWEREHWHGEVDQNQHSTKHRAITALSILVFAFLAYEGWHILTYLKPPWR